MGPLWPGREGGRRCYLQGSFFLDEMACDTGRAKESFINHGSGRDPSNVELGTLYGGHIPNTASSFLFFSFFSSFYNRTREERFLQERKKKKQAYFECSTERRARGRARKPVQFPRLPIPLPTTRSMFGAGSAKITFGVLRTVAELLHISGSIRVLT